MVLSFSRMEKALTRLNDVVRFVMYLALRSSRRKLTPLVYYWLVCLGSSVSLAGVTYCDLGGDECCEVGSEASIGD